MYKNFLDSSNEDIQYLVTREEHHCWEEGGIRFDIVKNKLNLPEDFAKFLSEIIPINYYCAYVTFLLIFRPDFNLRFLRDKLSCHGGVTLAQTNEDGSITLGFDFAHVNSPRDITLEEVREELKEFAKNVQAAPKLAYAQ
jgi:hypothetical protein